MSADKNPLSGDSTPLYDYLLPGGDCWIVYPYKGRVMSSIRLEAMRDGLYDYELLKMFKAKDPDNAREICGQLILDFDHYDMNITAFRTLSRQLLEKLSK